MTANLRGYDAVRITAMGFVAIQHLVSLSGIETNDVFWGLDLGQTGVSVFCGLSGFFALRGTDKSTVTWLWRRLQKIYVPYWLSLLGMLAANAVVHYKPVALDQILSQIAGTGYFTHSTNLLGTHTWFISLILVCYAIAVVLRWHISLLPLVVIAAILLLPLDRHFLRHTISFLAGAVIVVAPRQRLAICCVAAAACATALYRPEFWYCFAAVVALLVGSLPFGKSSRAFALASQATYEFFLVHGPIFLGLARMANLGIVETLLVGTVLAGFATWMLRRLSQFVLTSTLASQRVNEALNTLPRYCRWRRDCPGDRKSV